MSDNEKKGFSGLSSLDTDIDPVITSPKPQEKIPATAVPQPSKSKNESSAPPLSFVVTPPPESSELLFIKKYWGWIVIGIFFIWVASSNNSPTVSNSKKSTSNSYSAPTSNSYSTPTTPTYNTSIYESMPSYGSAQILNTNEIYYCLAEEVRIEANRTTQNQYDDYSVEKFNRTIADYNSRCSNFRYKEFSMSAAKKELEINRYTLEGQGIARN
jgi:hypothetical protein